MNVRSLLLVLTILFLGSSCSSIMVSHDFDQSTTFSEYSKFVIAQKDPERKADPRFDNEILNNRFNTLISERLIEKGFSPKARRDKNGLVVSYNYSIRPKMDLLNINKQVGFSFGSYNRYGGVGAKTCTDISEFDQGILFIDIRDNSNGKLIWRGMATDIVSIYATPEKINTQAEEMVAAVLKKFPPR